MANVNIRGRITSKCSHISLFFHIVLFILSLHFTTPAGLSFPLSRRSTRYPLALLNFVLRTVSLHTRLRAKFIFQEGSIDIIN